MNTISAPEDFVASYEYEVGEDLTIDLAEIAFTNTLGFCGPIERTYLASGATEALVS